MNIEQMIQNNLGIDTSKDIWASAFKKFKVDTGEDIGELKCFDVYSCKISARNIQGEELVKGISGCAAATTKGLVILGVQENKFPVTLFLRKNEIRVLQVNDKMFNTIGTLITDKLTIDLTVPKKFSTKFEGMLNKARNA